MMSMDTLRSRRSNSCSTGIFDLFSPSSSSNGEDTAAAAEGANAAINFMKPLAKQQEQNQEVPLELHYRKQQLQPVKAREREEEEQDMQRLKSQRKRHADEKQSRGMMHLEEVLQQRGEKVHKKLKLQEKVKQDSVLLEVRGQQRLREEKAKQQQQQHVKCKPLGFSGAADDDRVVQQHDQGDVQKELRQQVLQQEEDSPRWPLKQQQQQEASEGPRNSLQRLQWNCTCEASASQEAKTPADIHATSSLIGETAASLASHGGRGDRGSVFIRRDGTLSVFLRGNIISPYERHVATAVERESTAAANRGETAEAGADARAKERAEAKPERPARTEETKAKPTAGTEAPTEAIKLGLHPGVQRLDADGTGEEETASETRTSCLLQDSIACLPPQQQQECLLGEMEEKHKQIGGGHRQQQEIFVSAGQPQREREKCVSMERQEQQRAPQETGNEQPVPQQEDEQPQHGENDDCIWQHQQQPIQQMKKVANQREAPQYLYACTMTQQHMMGSQIQETKTQEQNLEKETENENGEEQHRHYMNERKSQEQIHEQRNLSSGEHHQKEEEKTAASAAGKVKEDGAESEGIASAKGDKGGPPAGDFMSLSPLFSSSVSTEAEEQSVAAVKFGAAAEVAVGGCLSETENKGKVITSTGGVQSSYCLPTVEPVAGLPICQLPQRSYPGGRATEQAAAQRPERAVESTIDNLFRTDERRALWGREAQSVVAENKRAGAARTTLEWKHDAAEAPRRTDGDGPSGLAEEGAKQEEGKTLSVDTERQLLLQQHQQMRLHREDPPEEESGMRWRQLAEEPEHGTEEELLDAKRQTQQDKVLLASQQKHISQLELTPQQQHTERKQPQQTRQQQQIQPQHELHSLSSRQVMLPEQGEKGFSFTEMDMQQLWRLRQLHNLQREQQGMPKEPHTDTVRPTETEKEAQKQEMEHLMSLTGKQSDLLQQQQQDRDVHLPQPLLQQRLAPARQMETEKYTKNQQLQESLQQQQVPSLASNSRWKPKQQSGQCAFTTELQPQQHTEERLERRDQSRLLPGNGGQLSCMQWPEEQLLQQFQRQQQLCEPLKEQSGQRSTREEKEKLLCALLHHERPRQGQVIELQKERLMEIEVAAEGSRCCAASKAGSFPPSGCAATTGDPAAGAEGYTNLLSAENAVEQTASPLKAGIGLLGHDAAAHALPPNAACAPIAGTSSSIATTPPPKRVLRPYVADASATTAAGAPTLIASAPRPPSVSVPANAIADSAAGVAVGGATIAGAAIAGAGTTGVAVRAAPANEAAGVASADERKYPVAPAAPGGFCIDSCNCTSPAAQLNKGLNLRRAAADSRLNESVSGVTTAGANADQQSGVFHNLREETSAYFDRPGCVEGISRNIKTVYHQETASEGHLRNTVNNIDPNSSNGSIGSSSSMCSHNSRDVFFHPEFLESTGSSQLSVNTAEKPCSNSCLSTSVYNTPGICSNSCKESSSSSTREQNCSRDSDSLSYCEKGLNSSKEHSASSNYNPPLYNPPLLRNSNINDCDTGHRCVPQDSSCPCIIQRDMLHVKGRLLSEKKICSCTNSRETSCDDSVVGKNTGSGRDDNNSYLARKEMHLTSNNGSFEWLYKSRSSGEGDTQCSSSSRSGEENERVCVDSSSNSRSAPRKDLLRVGSLISSNSDKGASSLCDSTLPCYSTPNSSSSQGKSTSSSFCNSTLSASNNSRDISFSSDDIDRDIYAKLQRSLSCGNMVPAIFTELLIRAGALSRSSSPFSSTLIEAAALQGKQGATEGGLNGESVNVAGIAANNVHASGKAETARGQKTAGHPPVTRGRNSNSTRTTATAAAVLTDQEKQQREYAARHKALPKVTGVRFQAQRSRFVAEWYEQGRTRMAYFPVKLYGFERARALAIKRRKEVLLWKSAQTGLPSNGSSKAAAAAAAGGCPPHNGSSNKIPSAASTGSSKNAGRNRRKGSSNRSCLNTNNSSSFMSTTNSYSNSNTLSSSNLKGGSNDLSSSSEHDIVAAALAATYRAALESGGLALGSTVKEEDVENISAVLSSLKKIFFASSHGGGPHKAEEAARLKGTCVGTAATHEQQMKERNTNNIGNDIEQASGIAESSESLSGLLSCEYIDRTAGVHPVKRRAADERVSFDTTETAGKNEQAPATAVSVKRTRFNNDSGNSASRQANNIEMNYSNRIDPAVPAAAAAMTKAGGAGAAVAGAMAGEAAAAEAALGAELSTGAAAEAAKSGVESRTGEEAVRRDGTTNKNLCMQWDQQLRGKVEGADGAQNSSNSCQQSLSHSTAFDAGAESGGFMRDGVTFPDAAAALSYITVTAQSSSPVASAISREFPVAKAASAFASPSACPPSIYSLGTRTSAISDAYSHSPPATATGNTAAAGEQAGTGEAGEVAEERALLWRALATVLEQPLRNSATQLDAANPAFGQMLGKAKTLLQTQVQDAQCQLQHQEQSDQLQQQQQALQCRAQQQQQQKLPTEQKQGKDFLPQQRYEHQKQQEQPATNTAAVTLAKEEHITEEQALSQTREDEAYIKRAGCRRCAKERLKSGGRTAAAAKTARPDAVLEAADQYTAANEDESQSWKRVKGQQQLQRLPQEHDEASLISALSFRPVHQQQRGWASESPCISSTSTCSPSSPVSGCSNSVSSVKSPSSTRNGSSDQSSPTSACAGGLDGSGSREESAMLLPSLLASTILCEATAARIKSGATDVNLSSLFFPSASLHFACTSLETRAAAASSPVDSSSPALAPHELPAGSSSPTADMSSSVSSAKKMQQQCARDRKSSADPTAAAGVSRHGKMQQQPQHLSADARDGKGLVPQQHQLFLQSQQQRKQQQSGQYQQRLSEQYRQQREQQLLQHCQGEQRQGAGPTDEQQWTQRPFSNRQVNDVAYASASESALAAVPPDRSPRLQLLQSHPSQGGSGNQEANNGVGGQKIGQETCQKEHETAETPGEQKMHSLLKASLMQDVHQLQQQGQLEQQREAIAAATRLLLHLHSMGSEKEDESRQQQEQRHIHMHEHQQRLQDQHNHSQRSREQPQRLLQKGRQQEQHPQDAVQHHHDKEEEQCDESVAEWNSCSASTTLSRALHQASLGGAEDVLCRQENASQKLSLSNAAAVATSSNPSSRASSMPCHTTSVFPPGRHPAVQLSPSLNIPESSPAVCADQRAATAATAVPLSNPIAHALLAAAAAALLSPESLGGVPQQSSTPAPTNDGKRARLSHALRCHNAAANSVPFVLSSTRPATETSSLYNGASASIAHVAAAATPAGTSHVQRR